jgi:hypothetical protein
MLKGKSARRGIAGQQVSGVQTVGHPLTEDAMVAGPSPTVRRRQLGEAPPEIARHASIFERLASLALDADGTATLLDQRTAPPHCSTRSRGVCDGTSDVAPEQLQQ